MSNTAVIPSPSALRRLYDWTIRCASTPQAVWTVNLVSFAESSFFPLPPDLMLIPMILADRAKAWWLAFTCTLSSVLGGLVGYAIGYFLFETAGEWIIQHCSFFTAHPLEQITKFQETFQTWGFWIIVVKGFTPIPFKLVTIASGLAGLNLTTFIIASTIARASRFFLVSGLLWRYGEEVRPFIEKHLTWVLVGVLVISFSGLYMLKVLTS